MLVFFEAKSLGRDDHTMWPKSKGKTATAKMNLLTLFFKASLASSIEGSLLFQGYRKFHFANFHLLNEIVISFIFSGVLPAQPSDVVYRLVFVVLVGGFLVLAVVALPRHGRLTQRGALHHPGRLQSKRHSQMCFSYVAWKLKLSNRPRAGFSSTPSRFDSSQKKEISD